MIEAKENYGRSVRGAPVLVRQPRRFLRRFIASAALVFLAGCSSPPPKPAAAPEPAHASVPPQATMPQLTPDDILRQAAAKPSAPFAGEGWRPMFDGQSLAGWKETKFAGGGEVECKSGLLVLNMGDPFTGINWTNDFPKTKYEVALDAMRVTGSDFFCGLTVPVGDAFCSLIVGGWGGGLVGISSLDGLDASENETTKYFNFEKGRWCRIRLRVTETKIEAWIDAEKLVNVTITGKRISLRPGDIELSKPFGVAAWETTAALRNLEFRRLD